MYMLLELTFYLAENATMQLHCDIGSAERGWFKTGNHSQYSQSTPVTNHIRLFFLISRSHDVSIFLNLLLIL